MTAPALPGAAPDPARLPPEVVNEVALLFAKRRQYAPTMDGAHNPNPSEIKAAQEAVEIIARALGGDGEPVAWGVVRDGRPGLICVSMTSKPILLDGSERVVPLYTRPAATGDHPSEARRGHESEGRGGPDAR